MIRPHYLGQVNGPSFDIHHYSHLILWICIESVFYSRGQTSFSFPIWPGLINPDSMPPVDMAMSMINWSWTDCKKFQIQNMMRLRWRRWRSSCHSCPRIVSINFTMLSLLLLYLIIIIVVDNSNFSIIARWDVTYRNYMSVATHGHCRWRSWGEEVRLVSLPFWAVTLIDGLLSTNCIVLH